MEIIGLEFLINIYGFKNKDIAEKLEISAVTVHDWIKGKRKIPLARVEQLSEIFNVPQEYLQKELNSIDEMNIQRIKLENEIGGIIDSDEKIQKSLEVEELGINIDFYKALYKLQDAVNFGGKSLNEAESIVRSLDLFAELLNVKDNGNLEELKKLGILDIINETLLTVLAFYNSNYSIKREKHELYKYESRYYRERDKAEDLYKQELYKLLIERDRQEDIYLEKRNNHK